MEKAICLGKLATIRLGYPFRGRIVEQIDSDCITVQLKDVAPEEKIRWQQCTPVALTGKRTPDFLQLDDILFVARGNHNYVVRVDEQILSLQKNAVATPHFFIIRVTEDKLQPKFLAWQLNRLPIQRYFRKNAEGSAAKSIRRSTLENTPIWIPPTKQQSTMIALMDNIQKQQQLAGRLIQNSENLMNALAEKLNPNPKQTK